MNTEQLDQGNLVFFICNQCGNEFTEEEKIVVQKRNKKMQYYNMEDYHYYDGVSPCCLSDDFEETGFAEKYELAYEYLDNKSMWTDLCKSIEFLKTRINLWGYKACTKETIEERVIWTKRVLQLVEWGLIPVFYKKRSPL